MAFRVFFVPLPSDMKHSLIYIILVILVTFTACGGNSRESSIEFNHVTVEKNVSIDNSKDAPQCHVHLDILQVANDTSSRGCLINEAIVNKIFDMEQLTPQAAADSFANTYTRDYRKNMYPLYREDYADAQKRPWYEFRYVVTTETIHDGDITNYLITLDYYEGGAHGITQLLTLNFDNKTGRQVTLGDIFGPDYEASLCDQLVEALLKKTGDHDLKELHQRGYLYSMDMFIPENYIIEGDQVTLIYNPYEIAPYSEGQIKLEIKR